MAESTEKSKTRSLPRRRRRTIDSDGSPQAQAQSEVERPRSFRPRGARRKASFEGQNVSSGVADSNEKPRYRVESPRVEIKKSPGRRGRRADAPEPRRFDIELPREHIDPCAAKVVSRLNRAGYEAYLVGGCVRDLLLNQTPKDFDVATDARPEDVRAVFRNSRIIGRRFRLVHVVFGPDTIIETATFRRNPGADVSENGELLIRDDNVFGDAFEDAERRDFTINGLFYDLENRQVIDWVGGLDDINARTVRTIGDPVVRFQEDPVRMMRAIKFSARLDLGLEPDCYRAIVRCRGALAMAARPRLFEEILRLLRGGAAQRSFWLCWELGLLDVLLPELATFLSDPTDASERVWNILRGIDQQRFEQQGPLDDVVMLTAMLYEPMVEICEMEEDKVAAGYAFLEPIIARLAMPRKIADSIRRIVAFLPRVQSGKLGKLEGSELHFQAKQVLDLTSQAGSPLVELNIAPRKKKRRRRSVKKD